MLALRGKTVIVPENGAKSGVPVPSKVERMAPLVFPQVFDNRKKRFWFCRQGGKRRAILKPLSLPHLSDFAARTLMEESHAKC